ncbi:MAG: hypothetical protein IH623_11530 [Verrucomicrobia bacterium]|nr:hypothetical protein [Verrucomicrobiota bacterium]
MHSILLIVKKPGTDVPENTQIWQRLLDTAAKIAKRTKGPMPLTEGVWLIPWKGGLPFVVELVQAAKASANSAGEIVPLSYKALIIDEHAEWSE